MDASQKNFRGGGRGRGKKTYIKRGDTGVAESNTYASSSSRDDSRQRRTKYYHSNDEIRESGNYEQAWAKFIRKQDPKYKMREKTFGVDDIEVFRREFTIGASDKTSRARAISEAVQNLQGCRGPLLDIGSMDGTITIGLKEGLGLADVYGIDLKPTLRDGVTQVYYEEDGVTMNLESHSMATVTCLQVLHHVENLEALANEIGRVMQPGGILYIKDHDCPPDHQNFRHYMDAVHKYYIVVNEEEDEEDPIFYRSRADLIRYFARDFHVKRNLEKPVGFLEVFSTKLCRKGISLPGWESQLMGNFMRSYYWYIYKYFFSDAPKAMAELSAAKDNFKLTDIAGLEKLDDEEYLRVWLSRESSPWKLYDTITGYDNGDIVEVNEEDTGYYLCGLLQ